MRIGQPERSELRFGADQKILHYVVARKRDGAELLSKLCSLLLGNGTRRDLRRIRASRTNVLQKRGCLYLDEERVWSAGDTHLWVPKLAISDCRLQIE